MTQRRTVFLVCPYGQVGGGMGSIMAYLASLQRDPWERFDLKPLESRGGGHIAWSPLYLAWAMLRIFTEAARGRLAVVHLNLAERGSVYRKAALLAATKLAGGKVLLHLHAAQIVQLHQAMGPRGRWLLRTMFRSADKCVVLGEMWRRWVIDCLGVPPEKIAVVYNGVPAGPARPNRANDGLFRLLFVGNLLERKGVRDLLDAFARLSDRCPNIRLTLAGGGPVETYQKMASRLGIAGRVTFTGWVTQSEARSLIAASDALILPAYDEGLPLVILEALASSTPVVCTPIGSIPEVLADRRTALFVRPGDVAGIAAAIKDLAHDPALGAHLSAEGAKLYRRLFTMDAFARAIGLLYATLTPASGPVARTGSPVREEGG